MATSLLGSVVDKTKVWKGAGRLLYAASGQSFPALLESIITPATPQTNSHLAAYTLGDGWNDLGGTSPDGITISRELETEDGVEIDQLATPLHEGIPRSWRMQLGATLMHTDYSSLVIAWELPAAVTIAANTDGPDYSVAQHKIKFSAPTSLTERLLAVVQQHPSTDKLRAFAFRKAKIGPEGMEVAIQKSEAAGLAQTWILHPDTTVSSDEDMFGVMFEEDNA